MSATIAVETLLTPEISQSARCLGNELRLAHQPWDNDCIINTNELMIDRFSRSYPIGV